MTDIDRVLRADAEQWQHAIDAGVRPAPSKATTERVDRHRALLLAVSSVALIGAILGTTLFITTRHDAAGPPASASALIGVEWTDPRSPGTVVFTDTTANIYDGCSSGLRALVLRSHDLTLGKPIGSQGDCGGTPGPQPAATQKFDRVLQGHLTWSITGRTLVLRSPDGASLRLTSGAGQPAPAVTGQDWRLERIVDRSSNELSGSFSAADFSIRNGKLRAYDLCNTITGTAAAANTTIEFGHLARTQRACADARQRSASAVIDDVLSGKITFTIRGSELILYGRSSGLLVYTPKP